MKIISSFSGGKTSAYMTIKLKQKYPDLIVLFANTGQENQETLDFVHNCDIEYNLGVIWLEVLVHHGERKSTGFKIVDYELASMEGEPFEEMILKYGIPNKAFPHCTRELKLNPIKAWLKHNKIVDYKMAVGIRIDEERRSAIDAVKNKLFYPFIEQKIDKIDVNDFWEDQPFNLELEDYQGNCKWCWKKSTKKLLRIMQENPEQFDFPERMEQLHGLSGYNEDGTKRVFFRGNVSTKKLKEMRSYIDDSILSQMTIFDNDENSSCSESCEPFI